MHLGVVRKAMLRAAEKILPKIERKTVREREQNQTQRKI